MFCSDPVAIEVSEGEWSVKESPSRRRCPEVDWGADVDWCGRRREQVQGWGFSISPSSGIVLVVAKAI